MPDGNLLHHLLLALESMYSPLISLPNQMSSPAVPVEGMIRRNAGVLKFMSVCRDESVENSAFQQCSPWVTFFSWY